MAPFGGQFLLRHGNARTIAAVSFLSEQIEKQPDRLLFPAEMMDHHLSLGSNATPPPQETDIAKEVRFDRHGKVAGHIPRGIRAFEIEAVGLRDHDVRIADPDNRVL